MVNGLGYMVKGVIVTLGRCRSICTVFSIDLPPYGKQEGISVSLSLNMTCILNKCDHVLWGRGIPVQ